MAGDALRAVDETTKIRGFRTSALISCDPIKKAAERHAQDLNELMETVARVRGLTPMKKPLSEAHIHLLVQAPASPARYLAVNS